MIWSLQHLAEEAFGGLHISFGAEHKVDRLAGRIDGAVKIFPRAFHFDIGFINAVGVVGWSQVRTNSSLQFRSVCLNPPIDRRVIDCQAALPHHFFEIAIAQTITQIPADAEKDDLTFIVSPFERIGFGQSSPR